MKDYVVWNGFSRDYITKAESPVRAIQEAMAACSHFVPSNGWNCAELAEFSKKIQKRIIDCAIRIKT